MDPFKYVLVLILCFGCLFGSCDRPEREETIKHRLVILTDMGNEPDDSQTMVHLLMYANEIDIEGLIAVTSRWLQEGPQPELIEERVRAYGEVLPNLRLHDDGWPDMEYLLERIAPGQQGYGMDGVGPGKNSKGSDLIIQILEKEDPRPVYFAINAGSNTLAQALFDMKDKYNEKKLKQYSDRIRVYDDAGQDNAGAWICSEFPDIIWIRSRNQVFSLYCGGESREAEVKGPYTWQPYSPNAQGQHAWANEHIQNAHGPLGTLYPDRFGGTGGLEGGGTTTWIGLVNKGLFNPEEWTWGGWGGRYKGKKFRNVSMKYHTHLEEAYRPFFMYRQASDYSTGEGHTFTEWVDSFRNTQYNPLWKWRKAHMNEFKCRMDWCVEEYSGANHKPVAVIDRDQSGSFIRIHANPGDQVHFDAERSFDPDGDSLQFLWFVYQEAGIKPYTRSRLQFEHSRDEQYVFNVPEDAGGSEIHLILQVNDDHLLGSLYDYRRVIIQVSGEYKPVNHLPDVSFSRPAHQAVFPETGNVDVRVIAGDWDQGLRTVQLFLNDEFVGETIDPPFKFGSWTGQDIFKNMKEGRYELTAVVFDLHGDSSIVEQNFIIRDLTPGYNEPPELVFANIQDGDTFKAGENLRLHLVAEDPDGSIEWVKVFLNNIEIARLSRPGKDYWINPKQGTKELEALSKGIYLVRGIARDREGLETTKEITVKFE